MKSLSKKIVISIIGLVLLGGAGYWFMQSNFLNDETDITKVAEKIEQRKETKTNEDVKKEKEVAKKVEVDMKEEQVQIYLHQMTHQKIVARKKYGAVEMTQQNISNLLRIVEENFDSYEQSKYYERTLMSWKQGDYSNAVSVHNTIWNWHNGTVGRATGLMSQEQEEAYVEKHFR